ncbi:flagellar hook-basal body complex protein FliE [mine drainage metagenome]|jgi:flagellar hook-basal body complex protein FliE|uniref:Flagellar hook-basal body complex protein FliE n=1 Tax=mine drainage metagenome TaxID=410659 RepID=A0A1J5R0U6_9ZZZZ
MNVQRMQDLVSQMRALAAEASARPPADPSATAAAPSSFAGTLQAALNGVNQQMSHADTLQQAFASGQPGLSLSDVMLAGQKASLSFQAALQVRNKLVSAYQDIMNIQA